MIKEFLKYDIDTEVYSEIGYTPIFYACIARNIRSISSLAENGADINKICNGITPLMYAAKKNEFNVIIRLLECGANPSIKIEGKIYLDYLESDKIKNKIQKRCSKFTNKNIKPVKK